MLPIDAVFVGLIFWFAGWTALFAFMLPRRKSVKVTFRAGGPPQKAAT